MDQKAKLKAMIGHIIEKNDVAAAKELHSYLAVKMQSAVEKATSTVDTSQGK